ncbi:MAG: hypothetical protein GXN93_03605 [Candidatus Diapherotrites archaeon]|nr:hypothetical protein [Candidatus Diapherotrites archaeon]
MRVVLLLDFDGVIVDSPAHFREATCDALGALAKIPKMCALVDRFYDWLASRKTGSSGEPGKFGRLIGHILYPLSVRWNLALARHSHVLPGVRETLEGLRARGVRVILFSSEDWVANYKERRVELAGVRDLFDDIVSFIGTPDRSALLRELLRAFPDATFVWVDDRPHRFIGNLNERVVPVWFKFPATARWEEAAAQRIPNLRVVENWREVGELVRSILSGENVEKEKKC